MNKKPLVSFTMGSVALLAALSAGAQSQYYWDATNPITNSPGSGGNGNWSISTADWWVSGSTDSIWANGNIANFEGTAGTVTLTGPVTADGLTFTTSGYTLGGSTLTLAGTPTITVPSGTESINCPIAGTVALTLSGSGTLTLGGTNTFTGGTTISAGTTLTIGGSGQLNSGTYAGAIANAGALIYDSTAAQTLSGTISGGGTLTQEGAGTLTLTHANTGFTGTTIINPGSTLALTSVSGAGAGTITNNGIMNVTVGASSFSTPVMGPSNSTININIPYSASSENIRWTSTSLLNYNGTVNLIAGLSGGSPGAGQLIITNPVSASLTWNVGSGATLLANTVGVLFPGNVILNGPGNSQPYGGLRIDATTMTGNVLLNGSGITIGDDNTAAQSQISGVISGNFGFSRVGSTSTGAAAVLILSGANTYTGPTMLNFGVLQMGSPEIPGTSGPLGKSAASNPGSIVLGGGTFQYSTMNSNDYSGRFSTNSGQSYNIDVNGQSVTFSTPLTSSSGSLTLKDTAGGGTLNLSGTNTYNGITTINSGTLNITGSIAGTVVTANGGVLELSSHTALPVAAILNLPIAPAGGMLNLNFSGKQTITTLNLGSTPQAPGIYDGVTNNLGGVITGTGLLQIQPPTYWDANGTDALAQTNINGGGSGNWNNITSNWWQTGSSDVKWVSNNVATFAGTAGIVTLAANVTADGLTFNTNGYEITNTDGVSVLTLAGTPIITLSGDTNEIDCVLAGSSGLTESGSGVLILGGSNTFTGATTIGAGASLVLNGPNAYAGPTTIGSGSSLTVGNGTSGSLAGGAYPGNIANNGGTMTYNGAIAQTLSGIISGSGTLTQQGPGPLTLSGLNTFTGGMTISSGTLLTISGSGDLGNNVTFNTGSYGGSIDDEGTLIYNSSASQTLSGSIGGAGSLTQSGSGTLTLSGNAGYSGATAITHGTLALSGTSSLAITASLSIAAGATLDASAVSSPFTLDSSTNFVADGTATAAATIKGVSGGGTVDLGTQPIYLTFTPQTFTGDATHQALNISQTLGTLNLNGNVITVTNAGASALGAGAYTLIKVTGSNINGTATLSGVFGKGLAPNTSATIVANGGDLDLVVSSAGVPVMGGAMLSGGNFVFGVSNGPPNATFYVLTSSNLSLPLTNWTSIATNTFDPTGAFTVTNTAGGTQAFFIIEVPTP